MMPVPVVDVILPVAIFGRESFTPAPILAAPLIVRVAARLVRAAIVLVCVVAPTMIVVPGTVVTITLALCVSE